MDSLTQSMVHLAIEKEPASPSSTAPSTHHAEDHAVFDTPAKPAEWETEFEHCLSAQLPYSLQEFFDLVVADSSRLGFEQLDLASGKHREVEYSAWNESKRHITMKAPSGKPLPWVPEWTRIIQNQWIVEHSAERLVLDVEMQAIDVPYGTTFSVVTKYTVEADGEHSVLVKVDAGVRWLQWTMMKSMITPQVLADSKDAAKRWLAFVQPSTA